jgi:hypothetical protein
VISNFSSGLRSSINNLIYSPRLISSHLQSSHLRDLLSLLGPGAQFNAIDQEDAFRANHINLEDAHLYCYQVDRAWFVDLRDPFGNVKSEWAYAIIVAVLKWAFQGNPLVVHPTSHLLGYVDNWFMLSMANDESHARRWAHLKNIFSSLGPSMHEEQSSTMAPVDALGWVWDTTNGTLSCPEDKYTACKARISDFARRAMADEPFFFLEIDSLAGLFQWVSTACPAIIPSVSALQVLKHEMKAAGTTSRKLDDRCKTATVALNAFFASWTRSCPLFAGFSPAVQWEVLLRCDASTDFGAGAICLPMRECMIAKWSEYDRSVAWVESRESSTYFELKGISLALKLFRNHCRGKRVQIECDSEPAIRILCSLFSAQSSCMSVVAEIRDFCAANFIIPRYEHILAQFNECTDSLSHNLYDQAAAAFEVEFDLPLEAPQRL